MLAALGTQMFLPTGDVTAKHEWPMLRAPHGEDRPRCPLGPNSHMTQRQGQPRPVNIVQILMLWSSTQYLYAHFSLLLWAPHRTGRSRHGTDPQRHAQCPLLWCFLFWTQLAHHLSGQSAFQSPDWFLERIMDTALHPGTQ